MSITCAALMCHAPIVLPAIAGSRAEECAKTTEAMGTVARALIAHQPDVLVVITPHAPRQRKAWGIVHDAEVWGSFARFGRPDLSETLCGAPRAAQALAQAARDHGLAVSVSRGSDLDHGALVPLSFVRHMGWEGPTLIVALPLPGTDTEDAFGDAIREAAASLNERWAILASGDMSHRLLPGAPAGYHPRAKDFDAAFLAHLRNGDLRAAVSPDPVLRELAAEDVVQSTRVAVSAVRYDPSGLELISYEGPFGVGYSEAVLYSELSPRNQHSGADEPEPDACPNKEPDPNLSSDARPPRRLAQIAHHAIAHALQHLPYRVPVLAAPWDKVRAVFVTLRNAEGMLRGCIGRMEPSCETLAQEVADNAVASATRDPRMPGLELAELSQLCIEVSVLDALVPIEGVHELDPASYGLVVEQGVRRGVLLPNVEGVDTAQEQLRIAMDKGRITAHEPYQLRRFRVSKVQWQGHRPEVLRASPPF